MVQNSHQPEDQTHHLILQLTYLPTFLPTYLPAYLIVGAVAPEHRRLHLASPGSHCGVEPLVQFRQLLQRLCPRAEERVGRARDGDGPDQLLHVHVLRELGRGLVHDLAESVRVIVGHVHFQRRVETPDGDDKDDEEKQRLSESSQESTQRSRKLYAPLKKSLLDGSRLHVVVAPEDFARSGDHQVQIIGSNS